MSDAERAAVGQDLLRRYEGGASIREICRETGYSIGRVRRLLEDAGVTYRRRGGANRSREVRPTTPATPAAPAAPAGEPSAAAEDTAAGHGEQRPAADGPARPE